MTLLQQDVLDERQPRQPGLAREGAADAAAQRIGEVVRYRPPLMAEEAHRAGRRIDEARAQLGEGRRPRLVAGIDQLERTLCQRQRSPGEAHPVVRGLHVLQRQERMAARRSRESAIGVSYPWRPQKDSASAPATTRMESTARTKPRGSSFVMSDPVRPGVTATKQQMKPMAKPIASDLIGKTR